MDHYKGAVPPPNESERMEAFNSIGLANAPHDPTTARLAYVLAKLLQVGSQTLNQLHERIDVSTSQSSSFGTALLECQGQ